MKSPAKQTTDPTGGWKNKTTDPKVLANRKAADAKLKGNVERTAKEKGAQVKMAQTKAANENTAKYNAAKAISTSKDKANDKMYGSWTNRQKADRTLKELSDSGYKPTTKATAKPTAKPIAKPAAKANAYEAANKGGAMDKLVKARNSAVKGSREYAAAQNQINAALGSKVRHTAKKVVAVSTLKPADVKKATITVDTPAKMKMKMKMKMKKC